MLNVKTALLVLAAGTSSRMGRPKAALCIHGRPLLELHILAYSKMGIYPIHVVLGHNSDMLKKQLNLSGAQVILNPQFDLGQFSSLQTGLRAFTEAQGEVAPTGVFVSPVDCPPVSEEVIMKMARHFGEPPPAALIPKYLERPGHPVLLGPQAIAAVLRADTNSTLALVLQEMGESVRYVNTNDSAILVNLNTPQHLEKYHNQTHTRI